MADISPQGIPDFGNLLTSYGRNVANQQLTQAQTGLTQASTGLTSAQTGLVGLQAQRAQLEIKMIQDALNQPPPDNKQDDESGVMDTTPVAIASTLNKKFFVDPAGSPQLQRFLTNPGLALASPQIIQRADEIRKMQYEANTARNANEANDIFQTSYQLKDSPTPLRSLLSLKPGSYLNNVGKAIASQSDLSDADKDKMASQAITAAAQYSHQYTGRKTSYAGDQPVDDETKFNVIAPKAGPTAGEQISLGEWANTPQTVNIDNRPTTIKPKDLGIKSYADLTGNKSIQWSVPPPNAPQQPTAPAAAPQGVAPPAPARPTVPPGQPGSAVAQTTTTPGRVNAFSQEQSDFVKSQPDAYPGVRGNSALNSQDLKQRDIYLEQRKALAQTTNLASQKAQSTITNVQRISPLLDAPGLTLGPGSREYSQMQTFLNQWFGTPTGQSAAYQVLSKFLNADQMNNILSQFHGEGAQVRLGAYESRLIMEQLAANPQMTKQAIKQMLTWQASDAQYDLKKTDTARAVIQSGKSVENFDSAYGAAFPKQQGVDTTISAFRAQKGGEPNYAATKGKTYTQAQVEEVAQQKGIPTNVFKQKLLAAGAVIQ